MGDSLDRDDIISGLRDLVGELHTAGEVAGIRLVGGAALVIRYFDRRATGDLDSLHIHPGSDDAVLAAAERVADRRGWSAGWFNFAVENADSVPTFDSGSFARTNRPLTSRRATTFSVKGFAPIDQRHVLGHASSPRGEPFEVGDIA